MKFSLLKIFTLGLFLSPMAFSPMVLASGGKAPANGFGIMQGGTDETSTEIAVLRKNSTELSYLAYEPKQPQGFAPTTIERHQRNDSDWGVDQLYFSGLEKNTLYTLKIFGKKNELLDERSFSTLDMGKNHPVLAFASCMKDSSNEQEAMWDSLAATQPDLLVMMGDNVYVSVLFPNSPKQVWKRYVETRNRLKVFHLKHLIPTIATWDDHDYGDSNDGGAGYAHKIETQAIFRAFFPQSRASNTSYGPGVATFYKAFGQRFYLMDGRSYRTSDELWGTEQENWLASQLDVKGTEPVWILNGTKQVGPGPSEIHEKDQPRSFARLQSLIRQVQAPFVFAAGDIHYTELNQINASYFGRQTFEIVSSSIHSSKHSVADNPNRIEGTDEKNFVLVKINSQQDELALNVRSVGQNQKEIFERDVKISAGR